MYIQHGISHTLHSNDIWDGRLKDVGAKFSAVQEMMDVFYQCEDLVDVNTHAIAYA